MKAQRTWIVVADGARARVFSSRGWDSGLTPALKGELAGSNKPTRELGSDRPGRAFESADGSRHAMAPRVDWHQYEKHLFAREVAALVDGGATRGEFDRLVIVAPPATLGELRKALGKAASGKVVAEIGKDLTGLDETALTARLAEAVPV